MTTIRIAWIAAAAIALAVLGVFIGLALVDAGDDGGEKYNVHIVFNETVTEEDMREAHDLLRTYDPDVRLAILESFPPQGSAVVETDDAGFCEAIVAELEAKRYVESATCGPYVPPGDDADEPVSTGTE